MPLTTVEQSQYGDPREWGVTVVTPLKIFPSPIYCHALSAGAQDVIVFKFDHNLSILKI